MINLPHFPKLLHAVLACLLVAGCSPTPKSTPERTAAAKAMFEHVSNHSHLPSAETEGPERARLLGLASDGYRELLETYPEQSHWGAQALRNLGNIQASQTNLTQAVTYYSAVAEKYPHETWESLMAWKSAADLLWDANETTAAGRFYQKIVDQYDEPDLPQLLKMVVTASQRRLAVLAEEKR